MKKVIIMLSTLFLLTGCGCNKAKYTFESVTTISNGETKRYTCSKSDKKDESVKSMCEGFETMSIVLKNDKKAIINFTSNNIKDEEVDYKIEDNIFYMEDEGEWEKFGTINGNKLNITMSKYGTEIIVVLKK